MKDLPAHQLDPKVKTVWRINDAIWLTVVFLCCFVPFAIAAMVDPATWMFVVLVAVAVAYAACLIVWLIVLPPIRFMRWRYELSSDYLDIAKGIVFRHPLHPRAEHRHAPGSHLTCVRPVQRDGGHGGRRA